MRRTYMRMLVMFLMVQACLEPDRNLTWLYSMIIYGFCEGLILVVIGEFTKWREGTDERDTFSNRDFRFRFFVCVLKALAALSVLYYQYTQLESHYVLVTASYYIISKGHFERKLTVMLEHLQLDFLEGLEQHYVHGFTAVISISYAAIFMFWTLMLNKQMLMLLALYTNIYLSARELFKSTIAIAISEWATIALFERATPSELAQHDDICAICLCVMTSARKTPCGHYFHGHCLRRCLKQKKACPMCNTPFQHL